VCVIARKGNHISVPTLTMRVRVQPGQLGALLLCYLCFLAFVRYRVVAAWLSPQGATTRLGGGSPNRFATPPPNPNPPQHHKKQKKQKTKTQKRPLFSNKIQDMVISTTPFKTRLTSWFGILLPFAFSFGPSSIQTNLLFQSFVLVLLGLGVGVVPPPPPPLCN